MSTIIERSGSEVRHLAGADDPEQVLARLSDLPELTRIVTPVLDVPHSRLDAEPPIWTMPGKKIGPFVLRTATVMSVTRVDDHVEVRGARCDLGDVPMRLTVDLRPRMAAVGVELVSDWAVQLESSLPRPLLRVANRVIDSTIAEVTATLLQAIQDEFPA